MVSCTGRDTADTSVPMMNVSMMLLMMTMMYLPTTVPSIPNGSILYGLRLVDLSAEERSVSVLEIMNLIKEERKNRKELRTKPSEAAVRSSI